jgi:hypothetical protein
MVNRRRLTRVVGVSVLTGATVLSQSGVASASEADTSSTTKSVTSESSSTDYVKTLSEKYGSGGDINSFGSIVNFKGDSAGNVNSFGSIANISAEDCADGNVSSFGSIVTVDEACADKIDSFGSIVKVTSSGDKKTEKKTETKKETKTETKTEKEETPAAAECPPELASKLASFSYTINGVGGFDKLDGNVKPGDTVKVDFEVAEGCEDVELSLVAYDAPDDEFTKENATQQVLFDSATGKFDAGKHSLEVTLPDCFFQVDFVFGAPIEKFGPVDSSNYYADQGRLIDAEVAGEECAPEPPAEPPVEEPPAEEPPAEEPPVEVEPVVIQQPELAVTGTESSSLATLGGALLLMGLAMDRASRRMRATA